MRRSTVPSMMVVLAKARRLTMDDWKVLRRELAAQGWDLEQTAQGHWRAKPPDRAQGIVHFSNSEDTHAFKNTLAALRKTGCFNWPSRFQAPKDRGVPGQLAPPVVAPGTVADALAVEEAIVAEQRGWDESPEPIAEDLIELRPVPVPPSPPAPVTSAEPSLDALFVSLRDARRYLHMADEHVAETAAAFAEAQRELESATREREAARAALARAKAEFDRAFDPPADERRGAA